MEINLSFAPEAIANIRVRLVWAQTEMITGTQDEIQFFASGDDESLQAIKVETEESALVITQPALASMAHKRWLQMCVRVPKDWHGSVDVDSVSGAVGAHGFACEEFVLASVSGPFHLEDVKAKALKMRTVSGTIAGGALCAQAMEASTVTGRIGLRDTVFEKGNVFTISGQAELALGAGCRTLEAQSVSGNVSVEVEGSAKAKLHSISGQFLLDETLRDEQTEQETLYITATSVSGDLAVKRRKLS